MIIRRSISATRRASLSLPISMAGDSSPVLHHLGDVSCLSPQARTGIQDLFARQRLQQTGRQLRRLVLHLEPAEPKTRPVRAGVFSGWKKRPRPRRPTWSRPCPPRLPGTSPAFSLFVRNVLTRTVMGAIWLIESHSLPVSSRPNRRNQRSISHSGKDLPTAMLSTGDASGSG